MIIFTNGCFDGFHQGHRYLLREAVSLAQGDPCRVIVAVNSDASVARLKGPGRPSQTIQERARAVADFPGVDGVFVFDHESELAFLIECLRPDVIVKGDDYRDRPVTGSRHARVVLIPRLPGISTTLQLEEARP